MPAVSIEFSRLMSVRISPPRADSILPAGPEDVPADKEEPEQKDHGHYHMYGLDLVIEVPKGGTRKGRTTTLAYGRIEGVFGADKEEVDIWVEPEGLGIELFFVMNQRKKDGTGFDEHKVFIGFKSEEEVREKYLENYPPGLGEKLLGEIKPKTLPEFKKWLETGDLEKPAALRKAGVSEDGTVRLARYECPECGGTAYNGCPESKLQFRGSGKCVDCGHGFSIVGMKLKPVGDGPVIAVLDQDHPYMRSLKEAEDCPPGECCPSCGARLERGDDGDCNRCGEPWPEEERDPEKGPFTIAVDLDGTLAELQEPFDASSIGEPREGAREWMETFRDAGARLIIFTVRGDDALVKAWLDEHEIPYDHVNENPDQPDGCSGKVLAHAYLDDRAYNARDLGEHCPAILEKIKGHVKAASYYFSPQATLESLIRWRRLHG